MREHSGVAIEDFLITSGSAVREALQMINGAPIKICLLVDTQGRLLRAITDGDIRRGLLAGLDLESSADELPGREPVTCFADAEKDAIYRLLDVNQVHSVILIDKESRPVGLADRASLGAGILMSPPHMGEIELHFVRAAFEDNWIAPAGPNLVQFEKELAKASGRSHALAVSSGTAALHLALRVIGVRAGDRVYVSDLTFAASLQPIMFEGAIPVLIDSEPDSWNMSSEALGRRLAEDAKDRTLPRAIILVHLYGQPADISSIKAIADHYCVPIVEDAAESLGASYADRPSGSHGQLAAFSFNGNKIITTSGGGALVGDDAELLEKARNLSTQGRDFAEHYQHSEVAYNYRMSNVLAGIGLGQLALLQERVAARRAIFRRYREGLTDIPGIGFQQEAPCSRGSRWLTVISLDPNRIGRHSYQLMRELRRAGIETRPGWKPMHMQPLCAGLKFEPHSESEPVSSRLFLQSLCLPSGSSMTQLDQDHIIAQIRRMVAET